MRSGGWCGHCGESFLLAELTAGPVSMRCPRCERELAPDYTAVAAGALAEYVAAAAALHAAAQRLHEVAPRLHLDTRALHRDVVDAAGG